MNALIELNPVTQHLPTNKIGRDFVMGDLHGCMHMLKIFLTFINFDKSKDRLFSVGDLVDRGNHSVDCLDLLKEPWFFATLGNHEDLARDTMENFLVNNDFSRQADPERNYTFYSRIHEQTKVHYANGGNWLRKYLMYSEASLEERIEYCNEHINLINGMPIIMVVGEGENRFNIVHSEILSTEGPAASDDRIDNHIQDFTIDNFIWNRQLYVYSKSDARLHPDEYQSKDLSRTFSGHTPLMFPSRVAQQFNIDTCAFYSDFISKDRNESHGLTFVDPETLQCWTVNGATLEVIMQDGNDYWY